MIRVSFFALVFGVLGFSTVSKAEPVGDFSTQAREVAVSVCTSYYHMDKKEACMADIRGARFQSEATQLCTSFYQLSDKQSCLKRLADKRFDVESLKVCATYHQLHHKVGCLEMLGNLLIDSDSTKLCDQYYQIADKQKCLARVGIPLRSDRLNNAEVVARVQRAIRQIDAGNSAVARSTLQSLLDNVDRR